MRRLKVTLLGCGSSGGVPAIGGPDGRGDWGACDPAEPANRRTRSSALIEGPEGGRLLVDAGPDLRAQLLAAGVGRVDAVLFTHAHADHIMGIDELRAINRATGRPLPAYATPQTLEILRRRFDYAFLPATPGFYRPALEPIPVQPGETPTIAGIALRLLRLDHEVMETLGLRAGGFAYCTDVIRIPPETLDALHGLDAWIVGCFQRRPHKVHADLPTVLGWVEALRPRRTVLTHMSPDLDYAALRRTLPPGVEPGRDGLVLEIGEAGGA
ncbi:metal-dependent hydrolase [Caldovatus sediminis]|uniref:Metal-dependent hydrolase n=1 Tax=Caldovatus sediminis TaxID=2041189 RepID=A0A8J3EB30_9PROT|nr:metal-dependent hydrolase [Caldovatus sediminis]